MKLLVALSVMIFSSLSIATTYRCVDAEGNGADLTVSKKQKTILWNEEKTSLDSSGSFLRIEDDPYSQFKGHRIYFLSDFVRTLDSHYELALSPKSGKDVKVSVYLEHDDREEEIISYNCTQK